MGHSSVGIPQWASLSGASLRSGGYANGHLFTGPPFGRLVKPVLHAGHFP